ncbi:MULTISPECIES: hypothetical protein [Citrobacter]|uniref:hypothetical protein n=1 Tax=Citrobacter TaxID=544 RepID=UPI000AB090B7|nr:MULTISPECIES: hypothetical protein [Citrobacter]MDM3095831.1 hypothetical protein [Citrobacter sp. Cf140]MDT7297343.1 hypothetical protein [Citrobacter freundii]MDT7419181.1 hypothetical protein [Citrobacter freundii]QLD07106.1 hypothetical protein HXS83_11785 [Citrobacter freundii]HAT2811482.1 hypothetical protein [Citrobacter freundii]
MKAIFTPQRSDNVMNASAKGDVLIIDVDGVTDSFDFSTLNDGDIAVDFISVLKPNPVLNARKESGEIIVELIGFYGSEAEESETQIWEVTLNG